jgi:hypothetical protein
MSPFKVLYVKVGMTWLVVMPVNWLGPWNWPKDSAWKRAWVEALNVCTLLTEKL